MENWGRYRLYLTEKGAQLGAPATNNLTEQMIGNGKVRSRAPALSEATRQEQTGCAWCLLGVCCSVSLEEYAPPAGDPTSTDSHRRLSPQLFQNSPTTCGTVTLPSF